MRATFEYVRRTALSALLCVIIAGSVVVVAAAAPSIELSATRIDFGDMIQNEVQSEEITVHNRGDSELVISEVYLSCPCTVAEIADDIIAPGASTILNISIHSRDYQGVIDKTVEISSDDPENEVVEITIHAYIQAPLLYEPAERRMDFGELAKGESVELSVSFHAQELSVLELSALEFDESLFAVDCETLVDAGRAKLLVTLRADAPSGSFRELIRIGTNEPNTPTLDFEASGIVLAGLVIDPDPVNFRMVKAGQALSQEIIVKARESGLAFKVTGAELDLPGLTVAVKDDGANGEARLLVSGTSIAKDDPLAKENRGRIRGTLRISTDSADQSVIEIDVFYIMRI